MIKNILSKLYKLLKKQPVRYTLLKVKIWKDKKGEDILPKKDRNKLYKIKIIKNNENKQT